jgi:hypothetical protein
MSILLNECAHKQYYMLLAKITCMGSGGKQVSHSIAVKFNTNRAD